MYQKHINILYIQPITIHFLFNCTDSIMDMAKSKLRIYYSNCLYTHAFCPATKAEIKYRFEFGSSRNIV